GNSDASRQTEADPEAIIRLHLIDTHLYISLNRRLSDSVCRQFVTLPAPSGAVPTEDWQTLKVHPLGFEKRETEFARRWSSKNPGHRYEVLTDENDIYYLETDFGPKGLNHPDIIYVYRSLTATIIKADLLQYLFMFSEQEIDMIIGVEIDQPEFKNHGILGSNSQSFCQWTFNVPISQNMLDFDDVISGTGPLCIHRSDLGGHELSDRKNGDVRYIPQDGGVEGRGWYT
ncbi:glycosyl transferase, partial [Blastomyces gilchristii SLH14081]